MTAPHLGAATLNDLLALGAAARRALRRCLFALLSEGRARANSSRACCMMPLP